MAAALDLFIVLGTKSAIKSLTNGEAYAIPSLTQGDTTSLSVTVLRQTAPFTFERIDPSTYTLRAGLFLKASPFTTFSYIPAASFTVDAAAQRQTAVLPLNTTAIDSAITAAGGDINGIVFQIEMTETAAGAITTIFDRDDIFIEKDYLTNATSSVASGETAATEAFVRAGFVPVYATQWSVRYEMDSSGALWKIFRDVDGVERSEPYTPP